ncbi:cell division protein FtsQ/DivIB [Propionicicella superfundia]|uniref:cell division protein FtsQ/DivIB n=1 Tax=Propionicicella superfundia TaxID=348582 RepID=UPI00041AEEA4|nr:FtsQ-type POTRA domain-containing protein [Propionicicella superfundia]
MSAPARPPRVSDATQRIRSRRRRTRLRRLRGIGIAVVVVALVVGAGWLFGFSSVFAVRDVSVTGTAVLKPEVVEQLAQVPVGAPLATVDPEPIAARVANVPEVKSVTVSRAWPDGIRIEVTERTAAYAVSSTTAGEYWLVDDTGVVFHTVTTVPKGLLVATSSTVEVPVLQDVATVVAALPDDLRKRVTSLKVTSGDDITLVLTKNAQVVWGSATDSELKGRVAAALLKVSARVYDVSSPTYPVTR